MEKAKITWYAKLSSEEKYEPANELYAGTYAEDNKIVVDLQIWNNRWGGEDVEALEDFYLNMFFDTAEDKSLFDYCTVVLNGSDILSLEIVGQHASLALPGNVKLSGTKNDGASKGNEDHFLTLSFMFNASGAKLKENDLKTLFFEIVKQ